MIGLTIVQWTMTAQVGLLLHHERSLESENQRTKEAWIVLSFLLNEHWLMKSKETEYIFQRLTFKKKNLNLIYRRLMRT